MLVLAARYIEDCSYELCSQHHLKTLVASVTEQISRSNCLLLARERKTFYWHELPLSDARETSCTSIKLQDSKLICLVLS